MVIIISAAMPSINKDIALEKNRVPPWGMVKNAKSSRRKKDKGLHPQQFLFKSEEWGKNDYFTRY